MHISKNDLTVKDVTFTKDSMTVSLNDGRAISVPLDWFPRLSNATTASLKHWKIAAAGHGIHWPELDEDISMDGLLFGQASAETQATNLQI